MLNPKNCLGEVTAGALVCAAAAVAVSSAAASTATRARRAYMDPPPGWRRIQYQIDGRASAASEPRDRSEPAERRATLRQAQGRPERRRRARARVGESEGRSPSD